MTLPPRHSWIASLLSTRADAGGADTAGHAPPGRMAAIVAKYKRDHEHPVNNLLHVGVGWPMVAAAVVLLPWRPWWSLGLFVGGYAAMFAGHFIFERNVPTVLKHPTAPLAVGWGLVRALARRVGRRS